VFSWPGVGKLAVDSITNTDVPLIMGTVLFGTFCIVIANLLVDVVIAVVDPRVRY
ncbi:MAG: ABC transporter permease subunit, partial [Chloroflexi bacterium]|nr:ABC transporter permease subunit [Chloroflexota bacterium]